MPRTAVKLGLALVSAALGFAALELYVARVLERDPLLQPITREALLVPQPGCGLPGWDARLLGCDAPLDPSQQQILIVGDSFAAGAGTLVQSSFGAQLRYPGFQVRNCAELGNNLNAVLASFDEQRARFRPAITIYAFVLNDFDDVPRSMDRPLAMAASRPDASGVVDDYVMFRTRNFEAWLEEHRAAFDPLTRAFLDTHTGSWLYRRLELRDISRRVEDGYRRAFEPRPQLEAAFDRIAAMAEHTDHLLVMVFPLFERLRAYPFEDAHRVIDDALERRKVAYLDLLDVYRGQDERDLIVCPTDHHPNARGHAMAAEALRQKLHALGWVPETYQAVTRAGGSRSSRCARRESQITATRGRGRCPRSSACS